ncbi:regulatory protein RecX [Patulibacter sp. SYSU D01012]|uniref:regulatory protein RecX n=1 Tax=Patulibacter sp. SYSU D01012 TaxID=2817381 RepID=UPI001B30CCEC
MSPDRDPDPGADDLTEAREAPPQEPPSAEERLAHALKLAYRHLAKRDRTEAEVRAHLEKRGVDAASVDAAVGELLELEYLDDERYAQRYVEDRRRLEGWGHLRIADGLRRTGLPRPLVERALAADPHADDEHELAVEALDRRFAGRALADDRERQKGLRTLATKGFPLDTAYAAIRAYERRCADRDDG